MSAARAEAASVLPRIALDRINVHLGGRHVLRDISWSLQPGQHWAVIGPNGSGKSTLLRVIAGSQWIDSDGGTRTYSPDGERSDVVARASTWIRHVWAEQHERYARLDLPLSGRAVIESGFDDCMYVQAELDATHVHRVEALLDEFDLRGFAHRPLRELSSGQIRRLLIARALAGEPRVLVLDEFTNGLDRAARRDVLGLLDRIAPRVALVIASHRLDDFAVAVTDTLSVNDGRLVGCSPGRPAHTRASRRAPQRDVCIDAAPVLVRIRDADVYRGRNLILKDVNWELRRGDHTVIRGPNGSGKTTFAGLIAGTISAATGARITRFGTTAPFDIWKLKERIAHVSDDVQIAYDRGESVEAVIASGFPASIGLFVDLTPAQRRTVADVLDRMGLMLLAGRIFTQLSFGERRKVLIARSLVRRPDIFILDEIANGLDVSFRMAFVGLLTDMAQAGTTIVAIAHEHDDDIVALTPRVCQIENRTVRQVENQAPRQTPNSR